MRKTPHLLGTQAEVEDAEAKGQREDEPRQQQHLIRYIGPLRPSLGVLISNLRWPGESQNRHQFGLSNFGNFWGGGSNLKGYIKGLR